MISQTIKVLLQLTWGCLIDACLFCGFGVEQMVNTPHRVECAYRDKTHLPKRFGELAVKDSLSGLAPAFGRTCPSIHTCGEGGFTVIRMES